MTLRRRHVGAVVGTAAVLVLVVVVTPVGRAVLQAAAPLAEGDVAGLRARVLEAGAWAPLALAGLMILQALIAPLPSSPVTYVNGLLFGVWWGALLSWASALVAAAICFGLSQRFGRPPAERLMGPRAVAWSSAFFERFGVYAVLLGRLLPFVSFDVVSYGAGLTRMSFTAFIAATAVGMIPGTLLYSYLGQRGAESAATLVWTLVALTALGLVVLLLGPRFARRVMAAHDDPERAGQRHRGPNQRPGGGR